MKRFMIVSIYSCCGTCYIDVFDRRKFSVVRVPIDSRLRHFYHVEDEFDVMEEIKSSL